jgi:hypothetical protein
MADLRTISQMKLNKYANDMIHTVASNWSVWGRRERPFGVSEFRRSE